MELWCRPLPSSKGSELWAPILNVVDNGLVRIRRLAGLDPCLEDHGTYRLLYRLLKGLLEREIGRL